MDTVQIQYFLSIVERGSFTEAAFDLNISQSSLSKRIISLEKELGVKLFDRSKRQISLTVEGEAFFSHAQQLYSGYLAMLAEIQPMRSQLDYLSIGTIPILTQYGLTSKVANFKKLNPQIDLNLEELDGANILRGLDEHHFNLVFTRHNNLNLEKYEDVEIKKDKFVVVLSTDHQLAKRESLSLNELQNENFVVFDKVTELFNIIMQECQKAGFEPRIFYSSHRKVSVVGIVSANIGLALMPAMIYEFHKQPDVTAIPLDEPIESNLVLAFPRNRKLSRAAKKFIEFMKPSS